MSSQGRTVIIGLDGVPFDMLRDLAATGVMPNTAKLISQGIFRQMRSSIPEISSVAWSCMITGVNPGTHGIYGFMDLHGGSYKMRFPNFSDLKAPAFWEQWPGQSVIINVPSTYPVRKMNGVHISGFVSVDFDKSVYPASIAPKLASMDYRLDANSDLAHRNMDLFLQDVDNTLASQIKAAEYLWDYTGWQTWMLVFTTTDRLLHFLFSAYEQAGHKYRWLFLDHFRKIDRAIGQITARMRDDDLLVMLSDHGFERLDYDVFINHCLVQQGLLSFKPGGAPSLENICPGTKAFALEPARIHLNYRDKYPAGSVDRSETEQLLSQLEQLFSALEVEGRKVVRGIYRKEQIYSGPYLDNAPDLVLVGAQGFNLRASMKTEQLYGKVIFAGKHAQHTAFLLVKGSADAGIVPENPAVADVRGIMEKAKSRA